MELRARERRPLKWPGTRRVGRQGGPATASSLVSGRIAALGSNAPPLWETHEREKAQALAWAFSNSTPGAIRTRDLCLRRAALYPAELRAQYVSNVRNKPSSVRRICIASRQLRQQGGIIYLGPALLPASSSLPRTQMVRAAPRPLFGLAPGGVCLATPVTSGPVRSYRTLSPLPVRPARTRATIGGLLSAALSVALRRPGVTRHPALRSSDFPPADPRKGPPAIPTRTLPTDTKSGLSSRIPVCP